MEVLTKEEVSRRMQALIDRHGTQATLAKHLGMSKSQMSQAVRGNIPVPPSLLKALKISRAPVYLAVTRVPERFLA